MEDARGTELLTSKRPHESDSNAERHQTSKLRRPAREMIQSEGTHCQAK